MDVLDLCLFRVGGNTLKPTVPSIHACCFNYFGGFFSKLYYILSCCLKKKKIHRISVEIFWFLGVIIGDVTAFLECQRVGAALFPS